MVGDGLGGDFESSWQTWWGVAFFPNPTSSWVLVAILSIHTSVERGIVMGYTGRNMSYNRRAYATLKIRTRASILTEIPPFMRSPLQPVRRNIR